MPYECSHSAIRQGANSLMLVTDGGNTRTATEAAKQLPGDALSNSRKDRLSGVLVARLRFSYSAVRCGRPASGAQSACVVVSGGVCAQLLSGAALLLAPATACQSASDTFVSVLHVLSSLGCSSSPSWPRRVCAPPRQLRRQPK